MERFFKLPCYSTSQVTPWVNTVNAAYKNLPKYGGCFAQIMHLAIKNLFQFDETWVLIAVVGKLIFDCCN